MKVHELITALQKLDGDLNVVVRGYEGGVNDIDALEECVIEMNANSVWYYGQHETTSGDGVNAVELSGYNKLAK